MPGAARSLPAVSGPAAREAQPVHSTASQQGTRFNYVAVNACIYVQNILYVCIYTDLLSPAAHVRVENGRESEGGCYCVCVCVRTPYEPFSNNSPVYRPSQHALPLTHSDTLENTCRQWWEHLPFFLAFSPQQRVLFTPAQQGGSLEGYNHCSESRPLLPPPTQP